MNLPIQTKNFCVYLIKNLINQKMYIGYSNNLKQRWRDHKSAAKRMNSNLPIYKAINYYGIENFELKILSEWDSLKEALLEEQKQIFDFKSLINQCGYNVLIGGNASPMNNIEVAKKVSIAKKKLYENPIERQKLSKAIKKYYNDNPNILAGRQFSEAVRMKIANSLKEHYKNNPEDKFKMRIAQKASLSSNSIKKRIFKLRKNHLDLVLKRRDIIEFIVPLLEKGLKANTIVSFLNKNQIPNISNSKKWYFDTFKILLEKLIHNCPEIQESINKFTIEEKRIKKYIIELYNSGLSIRKISKKLTEEQILPLFGTKWSISSLQRFLSNI